ncbi:MAG TPA: hypothetical protein VGR09_07845 [Gemmatimonadales bacterium]|nr:hypothetical protein [Gemmatimonadales bacterium]
MASQLTDELKGRVLSLAPPEITIRETPEACEKCDGPVHVQKTVSREVRTLAHGTVKAREIIHVCSNECRWENGTHVVHRPQGLQSILIPNSSTGYDLMVHIGRLRYLQGQQRAEISGTLLGQYGLRIPDSEIGFLQEQFLYYLNRLHQLRAPQLKEALARSGGWPMHIDATTEDGRGTLFAVMAGWQGWVLGAWHLPTERAELIVPHLQEMVERFGAPCAIMRDLGQAVRLASDELNLGREHPIPILSCHQHFLADIGKDLMNDSHQKLRQLFQHFGVRPALRTLARDLGRTLGADIEPARDALKLWQDSSPHDYVLPPGNAGLAIVRAMTQWVLDFGAKGEYHLFPYDQPYLELFDRCTQVRRAADSFLRTPPSDNRVRKAVEKLCRVLDPVTAEVPFQGVATRLRTRVTLFESLRQALRLTPRAPRVLNVPAAPKISPVKAQQEILDIKKALEDLTEHLQQTRPERGPAQETREAIDLVLDHIARHGSSLFGHAMTLPGETGGGIRLVARTNNGLENFWDLLKYQERRRSGRKKLGYDFEHLPAEAALALNLRDPDYVSLLCGSMDRLPQAFAALDAKERQERRQSPPAKAPTDAKPEPVLASASLPAPDRKLIRREKMTYRIETAARSRAPRFTTATQPASSSSKTYSEPAQLTSHG